MSNVAEFKPKADLDSAKQLDSFISWAKDTLPKGIPDLVHESIQWDMPSWTQSGVSRASFTAQDSPKYARDETRILMQPPFIDFAKAMIVHLRVFLRKKSAGDWLSSLKALEAALVDLKGTGDVTQVSAAVCNRACEYLEEKYRESSNNARNQSLYLEKHIKFMEKKGLLANPFRWRTPIAHKRTHGTLKQQKQHNEKKLPSRESLQALGELFNNDLSLPIEIVVTSACALLLSQPSRIGELADVERDCILFKDGVNGDQRMFLRWYAEKGYGATTKPVVTGMESVVKCAVERIRAITDEARSYAAWLEDHPDEFPPHDSMPNKGLDEPLTYPEACAALKFTGPHAPRSVFKLTFINVLAKSNSLRPATRKILAEILDGWDTSAGRRIYIKNMRGIQGIEFDDKVVITLRKLNILVREKYLPIDFPYTTPPEEGKNRVKYRDALFTIRTGALIAENAVASLPDFGVEIAANPGRISHQLAGYRNTKSIFERHGYKGVKVNTHAFRHELNTEMHRAGLSQLLIDAFSGRTSMGHVYNHETVEERTSAVTAVHPKTKQSNAALRLEKIRTNEPLRLSDVTDLEENSQNRVIHQTHLGICVHRFESEPCPKMGACLSCGNLGCVKGDDVKLANLKEERADLKKRYEKALEAEAQEELGAVVWRKKVGLDLFKCNALIKTLENPELEQGDIVWNADNGWNLTNNAAVMAGLIDAKTIEAPKEAGLPSLEELSAMLDEIKE